MLLLNLKMILLSLYLKLNIEQKREFIKNLTPKQMFQRLPITLTQIKAVNTSEDLLNEISQIDNSFKLL